MNFRIKYILVLENREEPHEIKVKNKESKMEAMVKLEDYLKRHHPDFKRMIVKDCSQDLTDMFGGIFNMFN